MLWNFGVGPPDQRQDALEHRRLAHVRRQQGSSFDELEHDRARLGVDHRRRDAGDLGGTRGGKLETAEHAMGLDVVADPDHQGPVAVLDPEVMIADAAAERFGLDLAAPAGERGGLAQRVGAHARPGRRSRASAQDATRRSIIARQPLQMGAIRPGRRWSLKASINKAAPTSAADRRNLPDVTSSVPPQPRRGSLSRIRKTPDSARRRHPAALEPWPRLQLSSQYRRTARTALAVAHSACSGVDFA
jgi:hypothetical protein